MNKTEAPGLDYARDEDSPPSARAPGMGRGIAGSLSLHIVVALLLIFGIPLLAPPLPAAERVIPIDLVRLGAVTAAPAGQRQPEQSHAPPAAAPPAAIVRPAPPAQPLPVPKPPEIAQPREGPKLDPLAEVTPERKPQPPDEPIIVSRPAPDSRPANKAPPAISRADEGPPPTGLVDNGSNVGTGAPPTVNLKDYIRAQVERHWEFNADALRSANFTVAIHIELDHDGTVLRAEIVDNPSHAGDVFYRQVAISARSAVIASSPLQLPPGTFEASKDIVLEFDPREAVR